MTNKEKLEILLAWLHDNVEMETDIQFTDGLDSEAMIPAVEAVLALDNMPKAVRYDRPWSEYYHAPDIVAEMNRAEAQVFNEARAWVGKAFK